jgi:hypothetical protein
MGYEFAVYWITSLRMTEITKLSLPQITQAKWIRNWKGYGKRRLGIIPLNFIISLGILKKKEKQARTAESWTLTFCNFHCPMILRLEPLVVSSSKCCSIRRTSLHCEHLNYDLLYTRYSVFPAVNRMHNIRVVLTTPWIYAATLETPNCTGCFVRTGFPYENANISLSTLK